MNKAAFRGLFLVVFAGALLFRLAGLGLRPMHHDEANQAVKFGLLLEKGEYRYDPADHHGPALYYLTLPLAWIMSKAGPASLDETTLRLLPAIFGAGILLLLLLLKKEMGRAAALLAGLFLALSPAFTFYSRFYIQETLFVFFVVGFLGSMWRYLTRPKTGWALAAGFFAGMMLATKETSVIVFAASAGALALSGFAREKDELSSAPKKIFPVHAVLALAVFLMTASLFFSSFFKNPKGIVDSFTAFRAYFVKGGTAGFHVHPWGYYIGLLTFSKSGGLMWGEALVLALACIGIFAALKNRDRFSIFISFYTLLATAVFSLIPYKTPWNLLPFYVGFIVLAGIGTAFLFQSVRKNYQKTLIGLLLAAGLYQLGGQSYRANFRYFADTRNPYVYAQTSADFLKLVKRVDEIAALHPEHSRMLIKVVCGPSETWPLPWYLRRYERVGYWTEERAAGGVEDAAVIIASQDQAERLRPSLQEKFQSEYYGLRPDVLLALFIRNDLWVQFLKAKTR